jgi:hypothetical protein
MSKKAKTLPFASDLSSQAKIGLEIQQLIFAALTARGNAEQWWATCQQQHRNDQIIAPNVGEGTSDFHIPFSQPRLDMLSAQVCTVVTRQDPYMLVNSPDIDGLAEAVTGKESDSIDLATHKQNMLTNFWKVAGFEDNARKACNVAVDTNVVWHRLAYVPMPDKAYGGIAWDVIDPIDAYIYPATIAGIQGARLVGHRFYQTIHQIEELQKAGVYYEVSIVTGDSPQEYDTSLAINQAGANPGVGGPDWKDQLCECASVLFRYSPDDKSPMKIYSAVIAFKQAALLLIEEYPYSRYWYFDSRMKTEMNKAYWPATSVGRDLSGLQDAYDKIQSLIYNGGMATAWPPMVGPELPEKDFRYGPGTYNPSDMAVSPWNATIQFRGEPLLNQLAIIERIGDQVARVSANTMGAVQARNTTATENSIIASGVAIGIEEYIANFCSCFGEMAQFTCELLAKHYDTAGLYCALHAIDQKDLLSPALWEPNGKTPGNTPGAKLAAAGQLLQAYQGLGPQSGLDPYKLVKVMVDNSGLSGGDDLQYTQEEMAQMAQPQPGQPPVPGQPNAGPTQPNPQLAQSAGDQNISQIPGGPQGAGNPPTL